MKADSSVVACKKETRRIFLQGCVQGIGIRPSIFRLAKSLRLSGYVRNCLSGVEILIEGETVILDQFREQLICSLPAEAKQDGISEFRELNSEPSLQAFRIRDAEAIGSLATIVPPDRSVCECCLQEITDPSDRRYRYGFTSCTKCGPRYSIIHQMPYERSDTSMASFGLCGLCEGEYESSASRRFHAQTNACDSCGPQLQYVNVQRDISVTGNQAIHFAAQLLKEGKVLAIKGLGGYQLLVDATCDDAVNALRNRKDRPSKPLALMVDSFEMANRLSHIDSVAKESLCSPENPIVLLKSRVNSELSPQIHPGLNTVGVMLPTTPVHAMLCREVMRPLVCTSGNGNGEALAFNKNAAEQTLDGICDGWLHHDRVIHRPIDDSVVRVIAGRPVTIRMARGLAPFPLELPESTRPIVALGGHLKSALAINNGSLAALGPHIGDLDSLSARERYFNLLDSFCELYGCRPSLLVHDQHPDYFTTVWACEQRQPTISVQHHWAHVLSGMLEHGWLDRTVLGVAWDGTGYGQDGTVWGGEFLISSVKGFKRVARFRRFPLLGGELCIRQPWRLSLSTCSVAIGSDSALTLFPQHQKEAMALLRVYSNRSISPQTSSAGRIFDAAAALILGVQQVDFEGQAATMLEAIADESSVGEYIMPLTQGIEKGEAILELDWRPMMAGIVKDRRKGIPPGVMSMKFHRTMASGIQTVCRAFPEFAVVLGGGVFQNRVITELTTERLVRHSQPLGIPGSIPPGDGGIAAGQLVAAMFSTES